MEVFDGVVFGPLLKHLFNLAPVVGEDFKEALEVVVLSHLAEGLEDLLELVLLPGLLMPSLSLKSI